MKKSTKCPKIEKTNWWYVRHGENNESWSFCFLAKNMFILCKRFLAEDIPFKWEKNHQRDGLIKLEMIQECPFLQQSAPQRCLKWVNQDRPRGSIDLYANKPSKPSQYDLPCVNNQHYYWEENNPLTIPYTPK